MRTPLTIGGHLERAALVYGDRIGIHDEPDAPGGGMGAVTYRRMRDLARLTGKASPTGELVDGVCDYSAHVVLYVVLAAMLVSARLGVTTESR